MAKREHDPRSGGVGSEFQFLFSKELMMLIFDSFASREDADRFVTAVAEKFGRLAGVYDDQDVTNQVDPHPFELTPPIVLVSRSPSILFRHVDDDVAENCIEQLVADFNGEFAGT